MNFSQECLINAGRESVWDFLMDMDNVSRCLPGAESISEVDPETYEGSFKVKVGPISVRFQGTLRFEVRDRDQWHVGMRAEAKDRRLGGGVRAKLEVDLAEPQPGETGMTVQLESHVLGKIGEFGQSMMKKKTDAILEKFAENVSQALSEG